MQVDALTLSRTEISTWRTDAGDIDLLVDASGKEGRLYLYEDLAGSARRLQVAGVYVLVASLQDVIASKEQADRAKDRDALPELYELRAQQGSTSTGPATASAATGGPRGWHPPRVSGATKALDGVRGQGLALAALAGHEVRRRKLWASSKQPKRAGKTATAGSASTPCRCPLRPVRTGAGPTRRCPRGSVRCPSRALWAQTAHSVGYAHSGVDQQARGRASGTVFV